MHKILLFPLFFLFFCNSGEFIIVHQPIENRITQKLESNYYLIRSIQCEVYVKALSPAQLNTFLKQNNIPKTPEYKESLRQNVFFAIKLKNIQSNPIIISRIYTTHNDNVFDSLAATDFGKSDFYKELSAYRRIILTDHNNVVSFPEESIPYHLNFIAPDDTIITIVGFPRKACANAQYLLNLELDIMGFKRHISFDIKRTTYRVSGKHFRQT